MFLTLSTCVKSHRERHLVAFNHIKQETCDSEMTHTPTVSGRRRLCWSVFSLFCSQVQNKKNLPDLQPLLHNNHRLSQGLLTKISIGLWSHRASFDKALSLSVTHYVESTVGHFVRLEITNISIRWPLLLWIISLYDLQFYFRSQASRYQDKRHFLASSPPSKGVQRSVWTQRPSIALCKLARISVGYKVFSNSYEHFPW